MSARKSWMFAQKVFRRRVRLDLGRLAGFSEFAAVTIIYVVVAKLSLALASINPSATPIWPTAGVALASVLLLGYRIAPAIFLGAFIVNVTTAGSFYTSLAIAAGNTIEGLVTAFMINEWARGRNAFERPIDVGKLTASFFVPGAMISAMIGVVSLSLVGYVDLSNFRPVWTTWWIGDSSGMLVIAPALVLWVKKWSQFFEPGEMRRSACLYAGTILIGLLAFSPLLDQTPSRTAMAFLAVLPLMWAAVRRNPRDTATTALLLSGFAVWGTVMNGGPFARSNVNESFLLLLAFMIAASAPSLALSAEVAERKRQEEQLRLVLRELSHRSKNLLQIVQSMANQVAHSTDDFKVFFAGFSRRLHALAQTHDLLVQGDWRGADIRGLVRVQSVPFDDGGTSITADGPDLILKPKAAEQVGFALHELGTNAVKHGALSVSTGTVRINWNLEPDEYDQGLLRLTWKESGGPWVTQPQRLGFGSLLLTKIVPDTLRGTAALEFEPDGLRWILRIALSNILTDGSGERVSRPKRTDTAPHRRDFVDA